LRTPEPLSALFAELGRLARLDLLEREVRRRGYRFVAGVDEAGRGSLAGPVVAAAVILPPGVVLPALDDSKKLDAPTRERLDAYVRRHAVAFAVGLVPAREIDVRDILRSSLAAMKAAVLQLVPEAEVLLCDAVAVPGIRKPQLPVVHGDALCSSIAAASILAKVHRDHLLTELARRYPAYGFEHHKGYGTPEHWQALRRYGPCPEHRLTYRGVVIDSEWRDEDEAVSGAARRGAAKRAGGEGRGARSRGGSAPTLRAFPNPG
jgi:ribonuclease HII